MFLSLKNKTKTERTGPELPLSVPLPDAPYLGKIFKASFSNCNPGQSIWYKVEKSSKVGQDFKSLLSNFACFLTAIVKV